MSTQTRYTLQPAASKKQDKTGGLHLRQWHLVVSEQACVGPPLYCAHVCISKTESPSMVMCFFSPSLFRALLGLPGGTKSRSTMLGGKADTLWAAPAGYRWCIVGLICRGNNRPRGCKRVCRDGVRVRNARGPPLMAGEGARALPVSGQGCSKS
jgi:hypothetical protein